MVHKMTLREKIGQMIMAGFPAASISPEYKKLIQDYKIANTILFSHNIINKFQVKELCAELQQLISEHTGHNALIAVDQEGGMVTRLPEDATNFPGAMAIAATGNPGNAYTAGFITGIELKALGVNVNMAPDLDINSNKRNPVIGVRSFGDNKEQVSLYGLEMMRGLGTAQVLPVVKHFPGHGDTTVDSHIGLPVIDKSIDELMENELVPFNASIINGAEAVMTSHILFPKIEDENKPATMSRKIITGLLREKLGFNGLVFSDCLEMDAVKKFYGTARGALEAIKAGVNIVCISHTPELVAETAEIVEAAVKSGDLPIETINTSVSKILEFKQKYNSDANYDISLVGCEEHKAISKSIREESITFVNGNGESLPAVDSQSLFIGSYANRSTLVSSSINKAFSFPEHMAKEFGGKYIITPVNPHAEEIEKVLNKAGGYSSIVYGTYNGHLNTEQIDLANRLCEINRNVIVIALRNPYDLGMIDKRAFTFAAYEYTTLIFDALTKIFRGNLKPAGKLNVVI